MHMGGDADLKNGKVNVEKPPPPYNELTVQTIKMKNDLNHWKEIILFTKSVLLWDKQWYPEAIIGVPTIIFMLLWLSSPSVLTTVALIGLFVTLADYFVPILAVMYFKPELWSKAKDQEFEDICRNLIVYRTKLSFTIQSYFIMRITKPKLFYPCTIIALLFASWIGCRVSSWILTYVIVVTLLLLPGLEFHGVLRKYTLAFTHKFNELSEQAKQKLVCVTDHTKAE